ncbi:MAG: Na/Pi cotransporter family protein, partial [Oligoflexia bacterium]|nr:Na/Pi cotransporter family protein [Oligoflexia bacterium]
MEYLWWKIFTGIGGGLAIFLYGMDKMSKGLQAASNHRIKSFLGLLTSNRILAMIIGTVVTALVQSSSATTVMLVGLVQSGLIRFSQTLGVLLGADIGTTVTVQLIALNLSDYSLVMVLVGFILIVFNEKKKRGWFHLGEAIFGCGLLFYGIKMMSDTMIPMQKSPQILAIIQGLENPVWGMIASAAITAFIHSSAATIGMVVVLSQQNLISLEASIPIIMGANIGTCVTAVMAAWRADRPAQRVALAHVLFKIGGVLVFVAWIPAFAEGVRLLSSLLSHGIERQVANAHTLFNVGLALVFLPFTNYFAEILVKIFPDKELPEDCVPKIRHLDEAFLATPAMAIDMSRLEISRMAKILDGMLGPVIVPFISEVEGKLVKKKSELTLEESIFLKEKHLDFLEKRITRYLLEISRSDTNARQSNEIYALM